MARFLFRDTFETFKKKEVRKMEKITKRQIIIEKLRFGLLKNGKDGNDTSFRYEEIKSSETATLSESIFDL